MYSDEWIKAQYTKSTPERINTFALISFWRNSTNKLIGATVDFELADDVHYEIKADAWQMLLEKVLHVEENGDYLAALKAVIGTQETSYYFCSALISNNIPYQKIAFY